MKSVDVVCIFFIKTLFFRKATFFFRKAFFFLFKHLPFLPPPFFGIPPHFKEFFASLCLCPLFESFIPLLKGVGEETICITGYVEFFKHIYSIYSHFNPSTSDERNIKKKIEENMKEFHKDQLVWSNIEDCSAQKNDPFTEKVLNEKLHFLCSVDINLNRSRIWSWFVTIHLF